MKIEKIVVPCMTVLLLIFTWPVEAQKGKDEKIITAAKPLASATVVAPTNPEMTKQSQEKLEVNIALEICATLTSARLDCALSGTVKETTLHCLNFVRNSLIKLWNEEKYNKYLTKEAEKEQINIAIRDFDLVKKCMSSVEWSDERKLIFRRLMNNYFVTVDLSASADMTSVISAFIAECANYKDVEDFILMWNQNPEELKSFVFGKISDSGIKAKIKLREKQALWTCEDPVYIIVIGSETLTVSYKGSEKKTKLDKSLQIGSKIKLPPYHKKTTVISMDDKTLVLYRPLLRKGDREQRFDFMKEEGKWVSSKRNFSIETRLGLMRISDGIISDEYPYSGSFDIDSQIILPRNVKTKIKSNDGKILVLQELTGGKTYTFKKR